MIYATPRAETVCEATIRREIHGEVLTGNVLVRIGVEHKDGQSRAFLRKFFRGTSLDGPTDGWYTVSGRDVFFPVRRIPEIIAALQIVYERSTSSSGCKAVA
ncbi:MAG TPA: hypothetical protein VGM13_12765 [Thermoanaerobaculia bacterium]|jgi:hypothetical protein